MNEMEQVALWQSQGEFDEIIELLEPRSWFSQDYQKDMALVEARIRLGELKRTSNQDLYRAITKLDSLKREGAADPTWWYYMGWAKMRMNQGGKECLKTALKLKPDLVQARNLLQEKKDRAFYTRYSSRHEMPLVRHLRRCFGGNLEFVSLGGAAMGGKASVAYSPADSSVPWHTLITTCLGFTPGKAPENIRGDAPERAELVMRFPAEMRPVGQDKEIPLSVLRAAKALKDTGGWFAPGLVLSCPGEGSPFTAVLIAPLETQLPQDRVVLLEDGVRLALYEVLFLTGQEERFCSDDRRVEQLQLRLKTRPLTGDTHRSGTCPEVVSPEAEEKTLSLMNALMEENHFAEAAYLLTSLPERSRTWRILLRGVEALLQSQEDPEAGNKALTQLQAMARRSCADPVWLESMGRCMLNQGRPEEAVSYLQAARARGAGDRAADVLSRAEAALEEQKILLSPYTSHDSADILKHVRAHMRINREIWMTVRADPLNSPCYISPSSDTQNWLACVSTGTGTRATPAGNTGTTERVELVMGLPEIWDTGAAWNQTDLGELAAQVLANVIWDGWNGVSVHPGDWFEMPKEAAELAGGGTYGGSIITRLPQSLSGMSTVKLRSGKTVCFYRLMFIFPEEVPLLKGGKGEAVAARLQEVPFGLESVRPALTAEELEQELDAHEV